MCGTMTAGTCCVVLPPPLGCPVVVVPGVPRAAPRRATPRPRVCVREPRLSPERPDEPPPLAPMDLVDVRSKASWVEGDIELVDEHVDVFDVALGIGLYDEFVGTEVREQTCLPILCGGRGRAGCGTGLCAGPPLRARSRRTAARTTPQPSATTAQKLLNDPYQLVRIGVLNLEDLDDSIWLIDGDIDNGQELVQVVEKTELGRDDDHHRVLHVHDAEGA